MDNNTTGYVLALIAIGMSFVAIRSVFPLYKLGAAIMWIAVFMWFVKSSPSGTAGNPFQVVALLAFIVFVASFPLSQLGRDIKRSKDENGNFNLESHKWKFGFTDPDEKPMGDNAKKMRELQEFQEEVNRRLQIGEYSTGGGRARRRR